MKYQRNAVEVQAIQYVKTNLTDVVAVLNSNNVSFSIDGTTIQLPGMLELQLLTETDWLVIHAGLVTAVNAADFIMLYSQVSDRLDTVTLDGNTILLENVAYIRGDFAILTKGVEVHLPTGMPQFKVALNNWRDSKEVS